MESYESYLPKVPKNKDGAIPKNAVIMDGEIIESKTKKLVSLEKGLRVVFDVRHYPGLVGMIDDLWKADKEVRILIWTI